MRADNARHDRRRRQAAPRADPRQGDPGAPRARPRRHPRHLRRRRRQSPGVPLLAVHPARHPRPDPAAPGSHQPLTGGPVPAGQRASDASLLRRLQAAHASTASCGEGPGARGRDRLRRQLARALGEQRQAGQPAAVLTRQASPFNNDHTRQAKNRKTAAAASRTVTSTQPRRSEPRPEAGLKITRDFCRWIQIWLRRYRQAPRYFSVLPVISGSEPGCGGDSGGCLVAGVDVGDDGAD